MRSTHTNRPLDDKINQVRLFCENFNEEATKYDPRPYNENYFSENGEIKSDMSNVRFGIVVEGVHTRGTIINLFIDGLYLYPGNQKDGTTKL